MLNEKEVNELKEEVDILNGLLAKCESPEEEAVVKKVLAARCTLLNENDSVKRFIMTEFDIGAPDFGKWHATTEDMNKCYRLYCKKHDVNGFLVKYFNQYVMAIPGVKRTTINVPRLNPRPNESKWKCMKAWEGLRKKGTSGIITA